jgi:acyl transferase domain-containing protein
MPGWGTGSFENEDARNLLGRLNSLGLDDLRQILAHAADRNYVDAPESGTAVAAAEIVAAFVAAAKDETALLSTPRQVIDWVRKSKAAVPPDLVDLARRAVERVRSNSELKDLWLEAEGLNEWSAALRNLEKRLGT